MSGPAPAVRRVSAALAQAPLGPAASAQAIGEALLIAALQAQDRQMAAEQALALQQANMAVTAHELRNPLAPLAQAVSLLALRQGNDPVVARVHAILERQLGVMVRLVGDLLDVSRAANGRLSVRLEPVDLGGVVDAAVDAAQPACRRRHQALYWDGCEGSPAQVAGDPIRLAQVLGNLLDNASKYTPDGGSIRVTLRVDRDTVAIGVSDSGIGISPLLLPQVFDAHFQEARAVDVDASGLGIGLMVAQELVAAHGGRIDAHSAGRGRGSEFVVTLPLAAAWVPARGHSAAIATSVTAETARPKDDGPAREG